MPSPFMSETAKVRELPNVMQFIRGRIADVGAGHDKITPDADGYDGRPLHGVDNIGDGCFLGNAWYDTIFSSHFLEHTRNPFEYIEDWRDHLNVGGHIVLYLPEKTLYNNYNNPEHMHNWSREDFMFWFRRSFCGEGKNYRGEHYEQWFTVVDEGGDHGNDRYSFFLVARRIA